MIDQESLVSWRSLSSETINNQQNCIYKIMFGLMAVITLIVLTGYLLSHNYV